MCTHSFLAYNLQQPKKSTFMHNNQTIATRPALRDIIMYKTHTNSLPVYTNEPYDRLRSKWPCTTRAVHLSGLWMSRLNTKNTLTFLSPRNALAFVGDKNISVVKMHGATIKKKTKNTVYNKIHTNKFSNTLWHWADAEHVTTTETRNGISQNKPNNF